MKRKNADNLLIRVLLMMHHAPDIGKRYVLRLIGESLVNEYKDLNRKKIDKKLDEIDAVAATNTVTQSK